MDQNRCNFFEFRFVMFIAKGSLDLLPLAPSFLVINLFL